MVCLLRVYLTLVVVSRRKIAREKYREKNPNSRRHALVLTTTMLSEKQYCPPYKNAVSRTHDDMCGFREIVQIRDPHDRIQIPLDRVRRIVANKV